MIKAFIFDFFGVFRTDAYEAWLIAHGFRKEGDFFEISRLQDSGEITNKEFCRRLSELTNINITQQELNMSGKIYYDVVDIAKKLKKHYKIALLSNSPSDVIREILADNDLNRYFDKIIISSEVKLVKPSFQIFTLTLNELGIAPSEALFVDDNKQHIQVAEKVGIKSIQFASAERLLQALKKLNIKI